MEFCKLVLHKQKEQMKPHDGWFRTRFWYSRPETSVVGSQGSKVSLESILIAVLNGQDHGMLVHLSGQHALLLRGGRLEGQRREGVQLHQLNLQATNNTISRMSEPLHYSTTPPLHHSTTAQLQAHIHTVQSY